MTDAASDDVDVLVPVVTTRYGVFMTPDPPTSAAVTSVTGFIRAQYGLTSAGAFPPHVTLAGSLPVGTAESELERALAAALHAVPAVPVQNAGVRLLGDVVVYDVDAVDGSRNRALLDLALRVDAAVAPLLSPTGGLPADTKDESSFHAHLSLASHELFERSDLGDEIVRFVDALAVPVPTAFLGDTVTLYRFEHPTWDGRWWEEMRWSYVRAWRLSSGSADS